MPVLVSKMVRQTHEGMTYPFKNILIALNSLMIASAGWLVFNCLLKS